MKTENLVGNIGSFPSVDWICLRISSVRVFASSGESAFGVFLGVIGRSLLGLEKQPDSSFMAETKLPGQGKNIIRLVMSLLCQKIHTM
jgi:hypothetical protein